jgi:hypothetical protein
MQQAGHGWAAFHDAESDYSSRVLIGKSAALRQGPRPFKGQRKESAFFFEKKKQKTLIL